MITKRITKGLKMGRFLHIAVLIFILGFLVGAPPWAQADIPRYINYQGKLIDAEDNPVTGEFSITVRIYDAVTGGTRLWTETQTATVTRGIFSILLGTTTEFEDDDMDFNSEYWYSVEIESDGEMTPRQRLTTVAYAMNADKLGGYTASQFLRADTDTALSGDLTVTGIITAGANEDVEINPTGTGNILMTIDSTSGDFKITDGTTNWLLVDNDTGNITIANNLTVSGTIYGTLSGSSSGTTGSFSSITVTGTSDLQGNILDSTGALTIADALTQTGASNQVTFAGNLDADNGLDVTGALTVSGATTLSSGLDMNANIDLNYSGDSAALDVNQAGDGAAATFTGGKVIVGSGTSNAYALSAGELYVQRDLEVDGTIYGNIDSSGSRTFGDTAISTLTVTGTSDLQGNVDVGAGIDVTGTANFAGGTTYKIDSDGTTTLNTTDITAAALTSGGTDDYTLNITQTLNDAGAAEGSDEYRGIKLNLTETAKTGWDNVYLMDLQVDDTSKFSVDNFGNIIAADTLTTGDTTKDAPTLTLRGKYDSDETAGVTSSNYDVTILHNITADTPASQLEIDVGGGGAELTLTNAGNLTVTGEVKTDTISEKTTANGVAIDGLTIKDSGLALGSDADGDIYYRSSGVLARLAKGSASQVLTMNAGTTAPEWSDTAITGLSNVVEDTTPQLGGNLDVNGYQILSTSNGHIVLMPDGTGNVGIGTAEPSEKLDVNGDIIADHISLRGASPATITFGSDENAKSLQFDPDTQEFSFTGGKLKQQFQNLVRAGSFESYKPTGWRSSRYWYSDMLSSVYFKFGLKSAQVYDDSAGSYEYMTYYIPDCDRIRGNSVTLSVWARCHPDYNESSTSAIASVGISAGGTVTSQDITLSYDSGNSTAWRNFTFNYEVPSNTSYLHVYLYGAAGGNNVSAQTTDTHSGEVTGSSKVYYDGVTLVEGKLALEYGPSPIYDTGDQVISGNLAIGADIDPYDTYTSDYYYKYPRLIFGEPDSYFGGFYGDWGMGSGEISFKRLDDGQTTFSFNRPITLDRYEISAWNKPALFIGTKYWGTPDIPDYAWTSTDAYIRGIVEVDGGIYGDIMSSYGGVGRSSNLLTYSQDFTNAAWVKSANMQVTNGFTAPDGASTACKMTDTRSSGSGYVSVTHEAIAVTGGKTYTFSGYAKQDSAQGYASLGLKSDFEYDSWSSKYVDLYGTAVWRRFSITKTVPLDANQFECKIEFYGSDSCRSILVWGAQIKEARSPGVYIATTDSAINNSTSLFHGDGSGLTNLSAANAGLLDNIDSTSFLRSDASDSVTTGVTLNIDSGATLSIDGSWDIGGTQITPDAVEINILDGGLTALELDDSLLTAAEGNTAYVNVGGDTMTGNLTMTGADISVGAGQKVNVKGSAGGTYMAFNSTTNRIEFYVDGGVVAYMEN